MIARTVDTLEYQPRPIKPPLRERVDVQLWLAVAAVLLLLLLDVLGIVLVSGFWF